MKFTGLSDKEVVKMRKEYGRNTISNKKENSFIKLFLESLGDPIIKILLIALAVKVIVLFKDFDFFETIGILISILVASLVSSISEYGSEAAFKRLQEDASKYKVKVKRNNQSIEIDLEDIVVNDIVILNAGDKVPADGHILKGFVSVDESLLNGETKEQNKEPNEKIYQGTTILDGEALMKVVKVGEQTVYGKLAQELQEKVAPSPLKLRLTELAKSISKLGYIGALFVSLSFMFSRLVIANNFNINLILNTLTNFKLMFSYFLHALTLSVTVIVVSVPEGLPLMITLVLSSNMRRMLKNNVLVRKLVGIDSAGNINVLLTDKTGTITKGQLEVSNFCSASEETFKEINNIKSPILKNIYYKSLFYNNSSNYSDGKVIGGNSTDRALLKMITPDYNINPEIIKYCPFNSKNKYSYVTLKENYKKTSYIKGAPELILKKSNKCLDKDGNVTYFKNKDNIERILNEQTSKGVRVIALAMSNTFHMTNSLDNLIFIALVFIKDELRSVSKEGISLIKEANINIVMITGDDKKTAYSIAKEAGIITSPNDLVITSNELANLSDDEIINNYPRIKVVARALPQDKSRLVKVLQSINLVVGMTGDGVNDAPALKKADVGFSMGSGTEVAKEASDIVILDDNILSISKAILYGRTIFKSIRKFIIFQLSVNICAVSISIIGPLIGINTPITIVQMLWINMIMDTLAGIAFSYEPPLKEYMQEKPTTKTEPIINKYMKYSIITGGLYSSILCLLFLKVPFLNNIIRSSNNNEYLLTAYFTLFVFLGIFNSFNARTRRINILSNIKSNKPFIIIIAFIIVVQLYIIYNGGSVFRTYGLTLVELFYIIFLSSTIIPIDWLKKYLLKLTK